MAAPGYGYGAPPGHAPPGYGAPAPGYGAPPGHPPPGYGAPPPAAAPAGWPPAPARPAFSYAGYVPSNPRAYSLFVAVDTDRSGSVNARELQAALSSGGMVFNPRAIKQMVRMFDLDGTGGTLSLPEFERLLTTLESWTALFQSADRDRSGKLSGAEVRGCLKSLGFNLPDSTLDKVWKSVDDDASGQVDYGEFVLILAQLSSLTNRFRAADAAGAGYATLQYGQFLDLVFSAL